MAGNRLFNSVKMNAPKVNKFDLSHMKKFSCNMTELLPVGVMEVLPGDRVRWATQLMLRCAPMLAPVMHEIDVYLHAFYVANRTIWTSWEEFITGGVEGTSAPVHPYIRLSVNDPLDIRQFMGAGSVADFLGVPPLDAGIADGALATTDFSALPFRAYAKVWNEYYRDPNLTSDIDLDLSSGALDAAECEKVMQTRFRAWEKDPFTSALLETQRGAPVAIPVTGSGSFTPSYMGQSEIYSSVTDLPFANQKMAINDPGSLGQMAMADSYGPVVNSEAARLENLENLQTVSMSSVSVLIEELRVAARLQEFLERMNVGGSRYTEYLRAIFGVISSDARLQRPEYLGGSKAKVVISTTFNTAGGDETQGTMTGNAASVGGGASWARFFEEHGFVVVMMSIIPRTSYMQGLGKMFTRFDRLDYFVPQFGQLGEQAIKGREVVVKYNDAAANDSDWGYQSRYWEYKAFLSSVHGDFRNELAYWHLGRMFFDGADLPDLPPLDTAFVTASIEDTMRIFAVTDPEEDHMYCQLFHSVSALRPLPYYNQPRL